MNNDIKDMISFSTNWIAPWVVALAGFSYFLMKLSIISEGLAHVINP